MRFVFTPPAEEAAGLLSLPWGEPLESWQIPADLRGRLAPTEIFHEILEHRWYMSEAAGRDVGTTAAARSYFKRILPEAPEPMETTTSAAAPNGAAAQPLEAEISSE